MPGRLEGEILIYLSLYCSFTQNGVRWRSGPTAQSMALSHAERFGLLIKMTRGHCFELSFYTKLQQVRPKTKMVSLLLPFHITVLALSCFSDLLAEMRGTGRASWAGGFQWTNEEVSSAPLPHSLCSSHKVTCSRNSHVNQPVTFILSPPCEESALEATHLLCAGFCFLQPP